MLLFLPQRRRDRRETCHLLESDLDYISQSCVLTHDLPIIQKAYDLIQWYVPILNRLPRSHKYLIGDRIIIGLYNLLENLIRARYERNKLSRLETLNSELDILRYQTRLLLDFKLMPDHRYQYAGQLINDIGNELGGWIKQQRQKDS